jgi:DHA1 family tetracycline resistance protein-like MFS transporter
VKKSPIIIVFITVFIDLLGFGLIIPLLPFYAESLGATGFTVGMLSTSFSLMQFIFAPIWGRMSDRVGRRPIILIGLFGSFLSYLAFASVSTLPLLFVARIFAGIAGANIPTAQAVMADLTTPENRAKGMGLFGAAFGLGFIFGPAIGGFFSQWGYAAPPLFAAGLSIVNFSFAWFMLPETLKPEHRAIEQATRLEALSKALARPHMPMLLLTAFLAVGSFSVFEATFALFAEHRFHFTAATIGYLFAFVGVTQVIVQGGLVGRASKAVGEHRIVPVSLAIVAVGLLMIPTATAVPALIVSQVVLAFGMGFNGPSLLSLISRFTAPEDQGGVMGLTQSVNSLARIVGPLYGGYTFDHFGEGVPFVSSAVFMACTAAFAAAGLWRARRELAPPTSNEEVAGVVQ